MIALSDPNFALVRFLRLASYSKNFRLRFWLAIISLKMVSYVMFSPSAFDEWSDETFRYLLKKLKAKLLKIEIIDKEWWPYSMVYHIILGDTAQIFYFSSPLRTRKNNGYATRTLWALFLCVKLIVYFLVFVLCCFEHFFLNWSCIFTSSEHRDAPMVWNLRQTIFCFDVNQYISVIHLSLTFFTCFNVKLEHSKPK